MAWNRNGRTPSRRQLPNIGFGPACRFVPRVFWWDFVCLDHFFRWLKWQENGKNVIKRRAGMRKQCYALVAHIIWYTLLYHILRYYRNIIFFVNMVWAKSESYWDHADGMHRVFGYKGIWVNKSLWWLFSRSLTVCVVISGQFTWQLGPEFEKQQGQTYLKYIATCHCAHWHLRNDRGRSCASYFPDICGPCSWTLRDSASKDDCVVTRPSLYNMPFCIESLKLKIHP